MTLKEFINDYFNEHWLLLDTTGCIVKERFYDIKFVKEFVAQRFGRAELRAFDAATRNGLVRVELMFREEGVCINAYIYPRYVEPGRIRLPDFVKARLALDEIKRVS